MKNLWILIALLVCPVTLHAQAPITYQGELKFNGERYTGSVNLRLRLFDQQSGGIQIGNTVQLNNVPVVEGLFQVEPTFGSTGVWRTDVTWLEVEANSELLSPRQRINPAPRAWLSRRGYTNGGTWTVMNAVGGSAFVVQDNGRVGIGTTNPQSRLHVRLGDIRVTDGWVRGEFIMTTVRTAGSNDLCYQDNPSSSVNGLIGKCSSSRGLKDNIVPLEKGSELLAALRPVRFNWKEGGRADVGLIAEEVAEVIPELATYDADGEVRGVNYRHLTAVIIGAWQEQQVVVAAQRAEIVALRAELEAERRQTAERLAALEALLTGGPAIASTSGHE